MISDNNDKGSSGVICVVSRQAGTFAGTSVAVSKRIAGCGVKTVATAKDWLKRPLKTLMPARDKKIRTTPEASALESMGEQETGRKKAAQTLIASLESKLAVTQRELKKNQSNAEKTESKLTSRLGELKAEKESLISDLKQMKSGVDEASIMENVVKKRITALETHLAETKRQLKKYRKEKKVKAVSIEQEIEPAMEPTVARSDDELNVKTEEQPSQGAVDAEMPSPVAVMDEEAKAGVFLNATDKIIFTRALSDFTSQDATVRADAAKTMACVRNELSVNALVTQMACESSAQVRQECIKALGTLEMEEALPTIERALADEAGSVRLAAVWGLYHLAGTKSAPALIRMLTDKNEEVRRRAATCIGWLDQEELAVKLLPLLNDNSVSVRRATVETMGNLRSRQVISSLIELLNDPAESVRKVVFIALEKITGKKMSKSLPKDEEGFEHLTARWQEWWKEEILG
ncbi:MAG: HEAT repeat domain-containing protein [Planctomycetota bacterium]|jgi:hypothetical protein